MTRRYVNLASRDVAEQHMKFAPMEWLLRGSAAPLTAGSGVVLKS